MLRNIIIHLSYAENQGLSLQNGGLIKGNKIIGTLRKLVGEILIENLPIPFTAVAADIQAEKEIWLNKGPLFDAIRASISLPLLIIMVYYWLMEGA